MTRGWRTSRRWAAGLALVGAALVACGGGGPSADDEGAADASTTTSVDDRTTTTSSTTTTTVEGGEVDGGDDGDPTDGAGTTVPPTAPSGPSPSITSFTTPGAIDCATGSTQDFTAGWATEAAVEVTIAIDGIVYDTLPPDGTALLPFTCDRSHTYALTARGDGGRTDVRVVTLRPLNVPSSSDGQDI